MAEPEREDEPPAAGREAGNANGGDGDGADIFSLRLHRYLTLRAAEAIGGEVAGEIDEAARAVVFTPASAPWQILFKLDLLQATQEFGGVWTDQRDTAYLGAIRADVIRWI